MQNSGVGGQLGIRWGVLIRPMELLALSIEPLALSMGLADV
jgi:hypothetical protein